MLALLFMLMLAAPMMQAQQRIARPTRIYGDLYGTFGRNASEFFRDYNQFLGGPATTFDAPLGLGVGVSSFQIPDFCFGLKGSYSRSVIRESYLFTSALDSTRPNQTTSQNMTVSVVPVMLTLDYLPLDRQFTTYFGVMAGMAFTSIRWSESLATVTLPGARMSGERYDDSHVSAAIGARAGVSLGWDGRSDATSRPAIFIEASYTFIPVSAPLLEETAKTLPGSPPRLREPYLIQAGGIGLHFGISLLVH